MQNLMQDHLNQVGLAEGGLGDVDDVGPHPSVSRHMGRPAVDNANLDAREANREPAIGGVDDLDDLTAQEVYGVVHADRSVTKATFASAASAGCSVHNVYSIWEGGLCPPGCRRYNNLFNSQLFRCNYFCISLASHGWRARAGHTDPSNQHREQGRQQGQRAMR